MKNDRDLVLMSIFTFVTVSLWIAFELLKTVKTTTLTTTTQQVVTPFNSEIDTNTLSAIANKKVY